MPTLDLATAPDTRFDTRFDPRRFAPISEAAFFFDVDGTLLDLRERPDDVVADSALRALLSALADASDGAVALVSGRSLADLDRIFDPLRLPCAALHGATIRFPNGAVQPPPKGAMDRARPDVTRYVADRPGLMLEDKGATLAVHYRQRPELGADLVAYLSDFGPGRDLAVQEGKLVVELKPTGADKGRAIAALMRHAPFAGRTPAFFGDDLTDEDGFGFVNSVGGVSCRIGLADAPTQARLHLPDPAAMRATLRVLVGALT